MGRNLFTEFNFAEQPSQLCDPFRPLITVSINQELTEIQ